MSVQQSPYSRHQHILDSQVAAQILKKKNQNKEGSWSLASSSASLPFRLQTTSLSIRLMGAGTEEGARAGQ